MRAGRRHTARIRDPYGYASRLRRQAQSKRTRAQTRTRDKGGKKARALTPHGGPSGDRRRPLAYVLSELGHPRCHPHICGLRRSASSTTLCVHCVCTPPSLAVR
eukprot:915296-Prymnesium_polylepis.2